IDVKMEGYAFTWSHPSATKMSKLDRFLVSKAIVSAFPNITDVCLDRHLSDHQPILLNEISFDFGPTPFRIYHSWFKRAGFDDMVEQTWNSFSHSDSNRLIRFKKKLQDLKKVIRIWVRDYNASQLGSKRDIIDRLVAIDKELDNGVTTDDMLLKRMELSCKFHELKQSDLKDVAQKAKIKWAIEGDENSKFFHDAFLDHSASRFKQHDSARFKLNIPLHNQLSSDQSGMLDMNISKDEIKAAVWDCGENKSPGPDGMFPNGCNSSFIALITKVMDAKFVNDFRPISLIGSVYKVVFKILAKRLAVVISKLVSNTQSAFISNRQILDGPFILNEVFSWCKRKKEQALVFKVDFAKAYDSVRWDFLLDVLHAFGFGPRWCMWVRVNDGIFKGLRLNDSLSISHLFYADDAVFIGEWSDANLKNLITILNCFHLASGLRINVTKNQVMGVGVPLDIVNQGAALFGCEVLQTPFKYPGVTITLLKSVLGAVPLYTLSIYKAPVGVLHEMEMIRNKFFIGGDSLEKKMTWIAWNKVLASKKKGGLGVSSFHALNRALLLKWVWRFLSHDGSLWSHVICAMYGSSLESHSTNISSIWCHIIREIQSLTLKGFEFLSHCKIRVGNGHNTRFWLDKHIRDGAERHQWLELLSLLDSVVLSSSADRWFCDMQSKREIRLHGKANSLPLLVQEIIQLLCLVQDPTRRWLAGPTQQAILNHLTPGKLPVRYLGVPLVTKKIGIADCKQLIDKVHQKLMDWGNKSLSYAGRAQLIASVLASMQVYWGSVFLLPKSVINDIENLFKRFLWNNREICKGDHKRFRTGNGKSVNVWHDKWNSEWSLASKINTKEVIYAGFKDHDCIADMKDAKGWKWPTDRMSKYPWLKDVGNGVSVDWKDIVWHTNCIPKHTFILWLAKIWKKVCDIGRINVKEDNWDNIIKAISLKKNKMSIWGIIRKICLAAVVYYIWHERNWRLFNNHKRTEKEVFEAICGDMLDMAWISSSRPPSNLQMALYLDSRFPAMAAGQFDDALVIGCLIVTSDGEGEGGRKREKGDNK
nr:putative RNA-directed DNA polymerase, eukaryota, reverse transcriptase zinc-binding domain protein [Tanacetum cinerariifolium]